MNSIFTFLIAAICCLPSLSYAQDAVKARVILIGDAGINNANQKAVIADAASRILSGKTTVLFLGNNLYPNGAPLNGHDEAQAKAILQSQYGPMRALGAPVYFIPGNNDWDHTGPNGQERIKAQWQLLEAQHDPGLKLVPANGCADPVAIPVGDSMVIFAMDTEWWLFPFGKNNDDESCDCNTSRDMTRALRVLRYQNRNKMILLATHHPFESYGIHGGYFPFKDHLFPLTAASRNLYLPLPVVGSLYPLYRKTFSNLEDLNHPLYKEMIRDIDQVFEGFPNLVHVSAHDNNLQFIADPERHFTQVISGSAAQQSYVANGKHALYTEAATGYVVADLMPGNYVRFTYYTYSNDSFQQSFQHTVAYTPYNVIADTAAVQQLTGDSTVKAAHPPYAFRNGFVRFLFGENYRKEWATPVKLPLIRIADVDGGLKPGKLGGGFQSTSLRLNGTDDKEYALRTVEKTPDLTVPAPFQGTIVRELLDDATSAQHPYAALIVAPVAAAAGVPHSMPVIGVVAPDTTLGIYQTLFEGKICLLEEREPMGKSDNTAKAMKAMQHDNHDTYDGANFLTARMVDLLFADWDRHADQWRFYNQHSKGEHKSYIAVPRDRDMVLNTTQGLLPTITKRLFVLPRVHGFKGNIMAGSNFYMFKSAFLNAHPANQISHAAWTQSALAFKAAVTDSVLEEALHRLPPEIDAIRHNKLLAQLQQRRNGMPRAMEAYYRFSNNIVDIHTSNEAELFLVNDDSTGHGTHITILAMDTAGRWADTLTDKTYPRSITKEIRLYTGKGDDSIIVNNKTSRVKLRIIGGKGHKAYVIDNSRRRIQLYDRKKAAYYGSTSRLATHLLDDSAHTAFTPVNLYNTTIPLLTAAINPDDGLSVGAGFRHVHQRGFRKYPYASVQQLMASHSFTTQAFHIKYGGEWIGAIGNADIVLAANIRAPDNTQNFFGRGNETPFDKSESISRYYRIRFDLADLSASLRWRGLRGSSFSIGPALEYYHLNPESNSGRFIENTDAIGSYDSATVNADRTHIGIVSNYTLDRRDNKVLPTFGCFVKVDMQAFAGANAASKSFVSLMPEVAFYKNLNAKHTIVLSDRIGGGISVGKTAFYQSMFLGGQGNLMGYRQYRFAGQHAFYNNLEMRVVLSNFGNYLIRGQFGIVGFYDIGRVWENGEDSHRWHDGFGAGLYVSPASLAVFRLNFAFSEESFYPSFSMGFRF